MSSSLINNPSLNPPSTIRVGHNNNNSSNSICKNSTSLDFDGSSSKNPFPARIKTDTTSAATAAAAADTASKTLALSPNIDSVIQGFQHELDTLSKSFDLLASSHSRRSEKSLKAEAPQHEEDYYRRRCENSISIPAVALPPPPTSRSQRSNENDSRSRSSTHQSNPLFVAAADETFATHTTNTTTRFEAPKPVETPVPSTTPGYSSSRHWYAEIPAVSHQDRNLFPENNTERSGSNNLEATIQTLKNIVNEQSATILWLQRDNTSLRKLLSIPSASREPPQRLEPMFESSNRRVTTSSSSTPHYTEKHGRNSHNHDSIAIPRQYYNNNNNISNYYYYDEEMKPTMSSLTTIPRDDDEGDENTLETSTLSQRGQRNHTTRFTPGTKFVAVRSNLIVL